MQFAQNIYWKLIVDNITSSALDIGVGLYTGATITDRIGNYVNDKIR